MVTSNTDLAAKFAPKIVSYDFDSVCAIPGARAARLRPFDRVYRDLVRARAQAEEQRRRNRVLRNAMLDLREKLSAAERELKVARQTWNAAQDRPARFGGRRRW